MDRLNLNHLYYFYIVAKTGSIKEASEKLHVTQPTISDQIKLLEEFLTTKLFDRKNRSLILNRDGEFTLEYAEKIFNLSYDLTARIRDKIDLPKRSLDIGITYKMSQFFLYDTILPLFGHEDIAINVKEGERHHLLAELERGEIDILFTSEKELGNNKLDSYKIGENKTYAVADKKLKKKMKKFPEGLNALPYFAYQKDSFFRYEVDMYFSQNGLNPAMIGEADDVDLHRLVVEKGLAFSIVPEVAASQFQINKNIVALGEVLELKTSVWGIVKSTYKGLGYKLLKKR